MGRNSHKPEKKEKCLDFVMSYFRLGGCWPSWDEKKTWRRYLYILYSIYVFSIQFIATIILLYGLIVQSTSGWKTLEEGVEDVVVFSTIFIVVMKMLLILKHQPELRELYESVNRNMFNPNFLRGESSAVVELCIKHERSIVRWYSFFGYTTTFLYTSISIINIIRFPDAEIYPLPLKYPFRPKGYFYFVIYIYQFMTMVACGHIGTLTDSLFSCFAFYISEQFAILSRRAEKEVQAMSKTFIVHHNNVLRMVKKLESIYGFFLSFELIATSALLCLGMVQVTQTRGIHLLFYLKCLIYVNGKVFQMVLYCWYGDRISEKSASVAVGAYSGAWPQARSRKMTHYLTMIMLRSQKSVVVRGCSYLMVSLPTMGTVINTAYTFFTMLRSIR